MNISKCNKGDIINIRRLWDSCFDTDSIKWRDWYFRDIFSVENVYGAYKNAKLVSMVHMNPYKLYMRGKEIKSYALAGVATDINNRKEGIASNLIKHSLNAAYDNGYSFSFLYPFSYSYYEKFGYKQAYNKYKYTIKYNSNLKAKRLNICDVFSDNKLVSIYSEFVQEKNGFVIRDSNLYKKRLNELKSDEKNIICFTINEDSGYYAIDSKNSEIEEIIYTGDMLSVISSISKSQKKDITFINQYKIDNLEGIKEPHCMSRVISVEKIFDGAICKNVDITIRINDDIIKHNCGVWRIKGKHGVANIKKIDGSADFIIDISLLPPIISGIDISEDNTAKEIQSILFDKTTPFIMESY